VALRDPAFRASLPPGYVTNDVAPEVLGKTLQDLLARLQLQGKRVPVAPCVAVISTGGA
jgi:hypothetical protein